MSEPTARVEFKIGELVKNAWKLFTENVPLLLGCVVLVVVINVVMGVVAQEVVLLFGFAGPPSLGYLGTLPRALAAGALASVVGGPLQLGFFIVCLRLVRRESADFGMLFAGFQRFLPAFLASLLIGAFMTIGLYLCVVPGLFIWLIYMLTYFYMADRNLDFWPAMEASRTAVMRNLGAWIVVLLTVLGINLTGLVACGVGAFVSLPVSLLMLALAYDQAEGGTAQ